MLGQRIGHYRIVRQIGEGGIGAVYEAIHETIAQRVAIKVLKPMYSRDADLVRRFLNEARALSRINHPGIVKVFDHGRLPDGTVYMMMEHLRGETLHTRLERQVGRLPVAEALSLAQQAAVALSAAHARGIVHRDVKPGNVFIVEEPGTEAGESVRLLDFGMAKLLRSSGLREVNPAMRTQAGTVMGTPFYMSPEQCQGKAEIDAKADVYALGVLLYRLLTGVLPFASDSDVQLFAMHIHDAPRPVREHLPSLPLGVDGLVQAMLLKDPKLRPSMRRVVLRLMELLEEDNADRTLVGVAVPQLPPPPLYSGEYVEIEITPTPQPGPAGRWRTGLLWSSTLVAALLMALLILHRTHLHRLALHLITR